MRSFYACITICLLCIYSSNSSYAQDTIAFVSNRGSGDISIIDTSKFEVIDTINVGSKPRGMAINPSCSRLYVTLQDSDEVVVIHTKTYDIASRIQVGNEPFAVDVHPSGNPIFVSNWQDGYISVINANNMVSRQGMEIGGDQQIAKFNPAGTEACATHRGNRDSISVIDLNKSDNIQEIPLGDNHNEPRDLVFHPSGKTILVALRGSDQISVRDAANKSEVRSIEVGREPVNLVVTRDGSKAYVSNNVDGTVSVINIASDYENVATVTVGERPNGLEITPDSKHVLVANKNDTLSVIDTNSNQVIKTINVGKEPWDVAMCQSSLAIGNDDSKRIMQIYGSVYSEVNGKKESPIGRKTLILDCGGKVQNFKTSTDGKYKIINRSGIKECQIKVQLNEVTTSWPPSEVIFSSKPRRYDLVY